MSYTIVIKGTKDKNMAIESKFIPKLGDMLTFREDGIIVKYMYQTIITDTNKFPIVNAEVMKITPIKYPD